MKRTVTGEPADWARAAAEGALSKKASDVVIIKVKPALVIVDYFILATADNVIQLNAVVEAVEDTLREQCGLKPIGREGEGSGSWVLLDYGDIVVHIFSPATRDFYRLETLYNDAEMIKVE
ncbi:MAG: ribosome silencing factor [Coriobacteriia bacterium]|nr:ribosome silencing factor [Coriobacteriia bacterium]